MLLIFLSVATFALTFVAFMLTYAEAGGSALEGVQRAGHCYLYHRGFLKEVSCTVFAERRGLELLTFATGAVTMGAIVYQATQRNRGLSRT